MSAIDRFDSDIGGALADLARPHYPDYFDTVLERAMEADQRPAWTFPERWLPMGVIALKSTLVPRWPWRRVGFVVALLALLLAATLFVVGSGKRAAPPFGLANNGNVIYVADGDIYGRPVKGTAGRLLVGGPETDVSPIFSRDGTKFAIIRVHEETDTGAVASILVANADGSDLHTVAGPDLEPHWWEWSPDSSEIAIASKDPKAPPLSIVNVVGDPVRRTVDVPFQRDSIVYWRPPDGRELIIVDRTGSHASIEVVKADGSDLRTLVEGPIANPFSFTPDGKLMTYTTAAPDRPMKLFAIDLESGESRELGTDLPALPNPGTEMIHAGHGLLTPDGQRIVFGRYWGYRAPGTIIHQLWVMSFGGDGSDAIPVSDPVRADHDPFFEVMSPDGTTVLYRDDVTEQVIAANLADGSKSALPWTLQELTDWQRLAR